MWDLVVFGVIGLLAGAAARLWYPGRESLKVLGTMLLGMAGALVWGLISWAAWTPVEGQVHSGALLMSFLGSVLALVVWPCWSYARWSGINRSSEPRQSDPVLAAEVVRLDLRLKQANMETQQANGVALEAKLGEVAALTVEEEANRKLEGALRSSAAKQQDVIRLEEEVLANGRQLVP